MTYERLKEAHTAEPFKPLVVGLADGRRFRIPSREYMFMSPHATRTFIVLSKGGEDYSIVDPLLVSSLDFEKPKRGGGENGTGNGHRRRH